jgi:hypothetical protein
MRILFLFLSLTFFSGKAIGHVKFAYIELKPVSCQSFQYEVIIHMSTDSGGPVLTSFYEISFGDGIEREFSLKKC